MIKEYKSRVIEFSDYFTSTGILARTLKLEMPMDFSFLPGQFVMIASPKIRNRVHLEQLRWASMSIASTPLDKGFIELGMDVGEGGGVRHYVCKRLQKEEEMLVRGPFGRFVMQGIEQEPVFIALGTGITPIMSMIRALLKSGEKKAIKLFYSIKNSDFFLFGKELEDYAKKFPNFELFVTVTRDAENWGGQRGRLQEHLENHDFGEKAGKSFFICGSPKGVIEIIDFLKGLGFRAEQIKKEQW